MSTLNRHNSQTVTLMTFPSQTVPIFTRKFITAFFNFNLKSKKCIGLKKNFSYKCLLIFFMQCLFDNNIIRMLFQRNIFFLFV